MRIEPISYQPYIYKPNAISSNSLSKVKPIGDDLLASKTDFSGLTQGAENNNPLRRGETANFADVLMMQMQMGKLNAERVMKPAEEMTAAGSKPVEAEEISQKIVPTEQSAQMGNSQTSGSQQSGIPYQMQRAMDAYQMFMTA